MGFQIAFNYPDANLKAAFTPPNAVEGYHGMVRKVTKSKELPLKQLH